MSQQIVYITLVVTLIPATFHHIYALDLQSSKETSCFVVKSVPVDVNWLLSTKWYYTFGSRYDLYRICADLAGRDPKDIGEHELYYDFCMTSWFEGRNFLINGFGRTLSYIVTPIKEGQGFSWAVDDKGAKLKAISYITLTDNKTFTFLTTCIDGDMGFGVFSSTKRLPEETTKQLGDYAETLGFNPEQFTGLRYDGCSDGVEDGLEEPKDEL